MPTISVVTPSFNQASYLKRTLDSVANQRKDLPEGYTLEHIIFDGNSSDGSQEILSTYPEPISWTSEPDKGQTDAINKGFRASTGDILSYLNSDDVYYPETLAKVVAFFNAHPDVDVVYGMADHIDTVDKAFEAYPTEPWNFDTLKDHCFICQPALFFRRRIFDKCGLMNDSLQYCMDYEYWLRLGLKGCRFAYLEEPLAGSRLYAETKTLGSRIKVHAETNDMFKKTFGHVPDRWIFNYAHAVVESTLNRNDHPHKFVIQLLLTSLRASWRWNRAVWPVFKSPLINWKRTLFR